MGNNKIHWRVPREVEEIWMEEVYDLPSISDERHHHKAVVPCILPYQCADLLDYVLFIINRWKLKRILMNMTGLKVQVNIVEKIWGFRPGNRHWERFRAVTDPKQSLVTFERETVERILKIGDPDGVLEDEVTHLLDFKEHVCPVTLLENKDE